MVTWAEHEAREDAEHRDQDKRERGWEADRIRAEFMARPLRDLRRYLDLDEREPEPEPVDPWVGLSDPDDLDVDFDPLDRDGRSCDSRAFPSDGYGDEWQRRAS